MIIEKTFDRLSARILGCPVFEMALRWAETLESGTLTPLFYFCRFYASLQDPWHSLGGILWLC